MEKYITSELEKRLAAFDDVSPILNDTQLKAALNKIIEETEPKTDADVALIDEAVEMLLELENVDVDELELSSEAWAENYKTAHKLCSEIKVKKNKNKKSIRIKWLMPVAALLSILCITVIVSSAVGVDVWELTKEIYDTLTEKVEQIIGGNSIIATKTLGDYDSLDEMVDKEDFRDILLPVNLDHKYSLGKIHVSDYGENKDITIEVFCQKDKIGTIKIKTEASTNLKEELLTDFEGYNVYQINYDDTYQVEFNYGENFYRIKAFNYDDLSEITKSLHIIN